MGVLLGVKVGVNVKVGVKVKVGVNVAVGVDVKVGVNVAVGVGVSVPRKPRKGGRVPCGPQAVRKTSKETLTSNIFCRMAAPITILCFEICHPPFFEGADFKACRS